MSTSNSAEWGGDSVCPDSQQPDQGEDPTYLRVRNSISEEVEKLSTHTQNECSIYKVPKRLRELNEDAYSPRIVSIGPVHYDHENLQAMEVHKTRYMNSLFQRTTDYDLTLSECLKEMLRMEKSDCSYYSEEISIHEDVAKILLVDGCFLLELFLRWPYSIDDTEISGDPIFVASMICSLQRDLALLENQIPFEVLQRLFDLIMKRCSKPVEEPKEAKTLDELCASFFHLELNSPALHSGYRHLLDLIRNCYLPRQPNGNKQARTPPLESKKGSFKTKSNVVSFSCWGLSKHRTKQRRKKKSWELIHCVSKLRECGIKFVRGNSENLFDIEFSIPKGELEIPELCITDTMDSLLRNMIAFEQCFEGTSHHITSYAVLMDYLIDSPADAEFLQHKRIIANFLGHGEEVSNIFNKISKKVFVKNFYFATLCHQVNEYSDKWWPRRRESLVRGYCFSPWKFIGVFAGSILLLFAGLQTGYTMASYHHPPK